MPEPIGAHNELTALAKDHVFALQLREVLSDSGPRRADQAGATAESRCGSASALHRLIGRLMLL
jgi:hypothetical protein